MGNAAGKVDEGEDGTLGTWRYTRNEEYSGWRIRKEPSYDADEVGVLNQGDTFEVVDVRRNEVGTVTWVQVVLPGTTATAAADGGSGSGGDAAPATGWSVVHCGMGRQRLFPSTGSSDGASEPPSPGSPPPAGTLLMRRQLSDEGIIVPPDSPPSGPPVLPGEELPARVLAMRGGRPTAEARAALAQAWLTRARRGEFADVADALRALQQADVPASFGKPAAGGDAGSDASGAAGGGAGGAGETGTSAAAAAADAAAAASMPGTTSMAAFSELTFYLRFYVANHQPIHGPFLALTPDIVAMVGGAAGEGDGAADEAWRFIMRSKLGEYTACGHFADTYTNHVYFESREKARAAAGASVRAGISRAAALLRYLDLHPEVSVVVRVERACFDKHQWAAYQAGTAPRPRSIDIGHVYMLDIPAASSGAGGGAGGAGATGGGAGAAGSGGGRTHAYFVQSALGTYDASVARVPWSTMAWHLHFIAGCDTDGLPISSSLFLHMITQSNFDVPTSMAPDVATWSPRPDVSEAEVARMRRADGADNTIVVSFDVFDVHVYDAAAVMERACGHVETCYALPTLRREVPYNAGTAAWSRVLDVPWGWNAAQQDPLRRDKSIGTFLEPHPSSESLDDAPTSVSAGVAPGAGSGAPARVARSEIECPACTFLNEAGARRCDMCGERGPPFGTA